MPIKDLQGFLQFFSCPVSLFISTKNIRGVMMAGYAQTIEALPRLDIRELKKLSKTELGSYLNIPGTCIGMAENQRLNITYTRPRYGGKRPWFICPKCGRRVAILYRQWGGYSCRHCQMLPYASQRQNILERLQAKISKIKEQLDISDGHVPIKPKNMRQKTFDGLLKTLSGAENALIEQFRKNKL